MSTYGTGTYGAGTYGNPGPAIFYTFRPRIAPDLVYPNAGEAPAVRRQGGRRAPVVLPDQLPGYIRRGR